MKAYNSLNQNALSIDNILATDAFKSLVTKHAKYFEKKADARLEKLNDASKKGKLPPCGETLPDTFNMIVFGSIFPTR